MNYKMTDYDIKLAYANYTYELYGFPMIFIDEYWDYYLKLLDKETEWNVFKEQYKSGRFTSYLDFHRSAQELAKKCAERLFNTNQSDAFKKLEEIDIQLTEWSDMPSIRQFNEIKPNYCKLIKVDLVSGGEQCLKYLGLFNTDYDSTYDIVDELSDYEIFKNNKKIRLLIFWYNSLNAYEHQYGTILTKVNNNILLKKIYNSNNYIIKNLNSANLVYKSKNDSYFYDITNSDDNNLLSLIGDYDIDGIKTHIDFIEDRRFYILNKPVSITCKNKSQLLVNPKYPIFFPLCASLCNGQTPTEKDLAIGYEDKIFFHLNENDYEKL